MSLSPYAFDGLATVLGRLPGRPYTCVLHVGIGSDFDPAVYGHLQVESMVLVDANGAPFDGLAQHVTLAARMRFVQTAVSTDGRPLTWHRYSLAPLDGPVDLAALKAHYPRLDLVSTEVRESRSMASLVQELPPARAPGDRLLVIDLPGQTAELLDALPEAVRASFGTVVARLCPALGDDEATLREASPYHEPIILERFADPLRPVIALRHDAAAVERDALAERIAALETALDTARASADNTEAHLRSALTDATQWSEAFASASAKAEVQGQRLDAALAKIDEAMAARQAMEVESERVRAAGIELARQAEALQAQITHDGPNGKQAPAELTDQVELAVTEDIVKAEDLALTESSLAGALEATADRLECLRLALQQERADLRSRVHWLESELAQAHGELDQAHAQRDLARDQNTAATQQLAETDAALAEAQRQIDAQHASARPLQQQAADLAARVQELESELTQAHSELHQAYAERDRAAAAQVASEETQAEARRQFEGLRASLRQELTDRQARAEWLESELNQARQSQLLATKLQFMRDADLRDLQERYRDISARQQSQRELLIKLAQRLTLAQEYFQQLPTWQAETSS